MRLVEQSVEAVRHRIEEIEGYHGIEEGIVVGGRCRELDMLREAEDYLQTAIKYRTDTPELIVAGRSRRCKCGLHDYEGTTGVSG